MSAKVSNAAPTGRTESVQGNSVAGTFRRTSEEKQSRYDPATLGNPPPNASCPEGAKEGDELPRRWRWATLGEVTESMKNGIYKPASAYADDGLACLRMYNIEDGKIAWRDIKRMRLNEAEICEYELLPGDLLVNRVNSRELVGKAVAIPSGLERCVFESKNIRVRLRRDLVSPEFASYCLLSAGSRYFTQNAQQVVGMASISQPQVSRFPLPLPPLPEQRRIVAEIEKQFTRLEAGVAALRRVQANLKRYRAAVLNAACEGQLVPTEAEWPKHQIANVIETMDQGWSPKCESEPSLDDETWAVIKTTAIQNLRFDEVENKKLPAALKPRPHLELQPGDLLVTRAGPWSRVGVACLVRRTRPRLMLCDKAYRLRCKSRVVNPAFLELILNAPHIVDAVNELKTGISDSGVNLTQRRFGELEIPLPPLAEQTRIVAEVERRLSVVEELESVVSANLQRATRLRQSILQKAFAGEL